MDRVNALLTALGAAALAVAVYALAVGTAAGRNVDDAGLLKRDETQVLPRVHDATETLVRTIDSVSLAAVGAALVLVGLLRGGPRLAATAFVSIAGANLTTQVLKPGLGSADPLGADALRVFEGSFPSGHATVAMSLALAAVLVAPPRLRPVVALVGVGYAAGIGIGLVALGWHYPSDVLGAYLVCGAWTAGAVGLLGPDLRGRSDPERVSRSVWTLLAGGAVALAAVGIVVAIERPELVTYGQLRTTFLAGAGAIVALAALVLAVAAGGLGPRGPGRGAPP